MQRLTCSKRARINGVPGGRIIEEKDDAGGWRLHDDMEMVVSETGNVSTKIYFMQPL
jgi:hypothetical protein